LLFYRTQLPHGIINLRLAAIFLLVAQYTELYFLHRCTDVESILFRCLALVYVVIVFLCVNSYWVRVLFWSVPQMHIPFPYYYFGASPKYHNHAGPHNLLQVVETYNLCRGQTISPIFPYAGASYRIWRDKRSCAGQSHCDCKKVISEDALFPN